jgi:hypothetical protein
MTTELDAKRFAALQECFDEGTLVVLHPDPDWGQLDPEIDGLEDLADWLIEAAEAGEEEFNEALAGLCPDCGAPVPGCEKIMLPAKFKCSKCLEVAG